MNMKNLYSNRSRLFVIAAIIVISVTQALSQNQLVNKDFDFLVGTFAGKFKQYLPGGETVEQHLSWNSYRVLNEKAIQSDWHADGLWFTTVLMYEKAEKRWVAISFGEPVNVIGHTLHGKRQGNEIVMQRQNGGSLVQEDRYFDITPTSFRWKSERIDRDGKRYLQSESLVKRADPSTPIVRHRSITLENKEVQNIKPTQERYVSANQEFEQIMQEWHQTIFKGDRETSARLRADDFTSINPLGETKTKEQELSTIGSSELEFESLRTSDVEVRLFGEVAVVTGLN